MLRTHSTKKSGRKSLRSYQSNHSEFLHTPQEDLPVSDNISYHSISSESLDNSQSKRRFGYRWVDEIGPVEYCPQPTTHTNRPKIQISDTAQSQPVFEPFRSPTPPQRLDSSRPTIPSRLRTDDVHNNPSLGLQIPTPTRQSSVSVCSTPDSEDKGCHQPNNKSYPMGSAYEEPTIAIRGTTQGSLESGDGISKPTREHVTKARSISVARSIGGWRVKSKPDLQTTKSTNTKKQSEGDQTNLDSSLHLRSRTSSFKSEGGKKASVDEKQIEAKIPAGDLSDTRQAHPKQRRSLFKMMNRKSFQDSPPSTPNSKDPLDQCSLAQYEPPKSPNKAKTGFFWHSKRASEDDSAAGTKDYSIGKSRRTQALVGESASPKEAAPEKDGRLKLRPKPHRFCSSPISPCDTSDRAMNNPAHGIRQYLSNGKPDRQPLPPTLTSTAPPGTQSEPVQFLSTEAVRVDTPPSFKLEKRHKFAGYFLDYWYPEFPGADFKPHEGYHTAFPMPNDASITTSNTNEKDWYRIRMDRILGEDEPRDVEELKMFEWDVPEHLPESPLCPLNPMHPSGGKGICVYHGRKYKSRLSVQAKTGDIGVELWS